MSTSKVSLEFTSAEIYLKALAEQYRAGLEQGKIDERAAAVRYLRVWADANRDNTNIDGALQALVTDTHAANIEQGEHIRRPAEDAAARTPDAGRGSK